MLVPITPRRKQLTDLFNNKDWESLAKFGVEMKEGPSRIDCGAYVLKTLGYMTTKNTVAVLWSAPRSPAPPRSGRCVVIYRFENNPTVQQHGIYQSDGKVLSKWGANEPVFLHNIEDVPVDYGDLAEFVEITNELHFRLQQALSGQQFEEDYY